MSAAVILIFLAVLITLSIIFDFWIYLLILGIIFLGIIITIAVREEREEAAYREFQSRSYTPRWDASSRARAEERYVRSKVEDEWNRQEFDDVGDLR
ncbi:MAG: hypothetical protein MN733_28685 [Nitrososphaera sp.]|nr:hypothetical protein [Nitrososphaera sp.]